MTRQDFAIQTKTLEEFYGKDLNYTQSDIWFEELKMYPPEKYGKAIRTACKTLQYKPTLSQILDIIRTVKAENSDTEKAKCEACHGTGYLIYKKVVNGREYEYGCLCACKNAIGKEYDGTKVADKEHRSQYYLERAENVFKR